MNDVDFNEIESISVLKDASATAVYGVRGANLLLTTKRGSKQKPKVNILRQYGIQTDDHQTGLGRLHHFYENVQRRHLMTTTGTNSTTSTIRAWEQACMPLKLWSVQWCFPGSGLVWWNNQRFRFFSKLQHQCRRWHGKMIISFHWLIKME